jgi:hypothetical protein
MTCPGTMIAAADLDADGTDDLIGIWSASKEVWVRYSSTAKWESLADNADWIATGDMNGDGRADLIGSWRGSVCLLSRFNHRNLGAGGILCNPGGRG